MPAAIGLHPAFRAVARFEFNLDEAIEILENAGWKEGASGIREKGGKPLKLVVQTSTNVPWPKNHVIVTQACQKAAIELEPKSVVARRSSPATSPIPTPTRTSTATWRC